MLYILWGEDTFSLEETLQEIKSNLGDSSLLPSNTVILDGQKLTLNELKAVGEAMPFLSKKRLVIVKGLLERFEPKERNGQPKKSSKSGSKRDESQLLAECLNGLPESTIMVLVENLAVKKNAFQSNYLYNSISAKAEIKSFSVMKGNKLYQWIQDRTTRKGGSISRQATNTLMEIIGGDLHTMANEIDKLVSFTGGRLIEEKDVRMIVSASQEGDIFAMIDAIMDRKSGRAEQILQNLLQNGVVPPQILVLIARQVQMLIQVKDLKARKKVSSEIQTRLGIKSPYAWERITSRADKYSLDNLKKMFQNILETDLSIKTGRFDGDLALNLLIANLCVR